jgi:hypothetical protein
MLCNKDRLKIFWRFQNCALWRYLQGRTIRLGYIEDGGNRQLVLIYQSKCRCVPEIQKLSQHGCEIVKPLKKCLLSFRNSVSLYALQIIALKLQNYVTAHWHVKRYFTCLVQLLLAINFCWIAGKIKSVMCDVTYLVNGVDNELSLLGSYSVSSGKYFPTFRMNLTHPSSVQEQRNFVRRLDPENGGT